jgi:aspartyl-tRNA(Asn)/glutamyl-tRNA(Gln) amidotransferase subunit A
MSRHPAATVPCGVTSDGVPVGLHIVSGHYKDALVLRAAATYTAAHPIPMPSDLPAQPEQE